MAQEIRTGDRIALAGLSFVVDFVPITGPVEEHQAADEPAVPEAVADQKPTGPLPDAEDTDKWGDRTIPPGMIPFVKTLRVTPTKPIPGSLPKGPIIKRSDAQPGGDTDETDQGKKTGPGQ
jgi:hypothetical protein